MKTSNASNFACIIRDWGVHQFFFLPHPVCVCAHKLLARVSLFFYFSKFLTCVPRMRRNLTANAAQLNSAPQLISCAQMSDASPPPPQFLRADVKSALCITFPVEHVAIQKVCSLRVADLLFLSFLRIPDSANPRKTRQGLQTMDASHQHLLPVRSQRRKQF